MDRESLSFFKKSSNFLDQIPFLNRQWISASAAVFAGFLVLLFSLQSAPKAPAFAQAEGIFSAWEASPQDEVLSQKMFEFLRKIPSLQQKYNALIAQKLIEEGRGAEALQMARRPLELARKETPFHAAFAETSLLIEQGEYQAALERAVALKEQMGQKCDVDRFSGDQLVGGAFLYAHNLLRVACLQQELKNRHGERAAWDELEHFLHQNDGGPVMYRVFNIFKERGVDLFRYISERKALLE